MYTQCPECETVFKLSAEVLRAAGGQVRCGKCGHVFNALARLAEDAGSFETGESSLELETRADNILESVPSLPVAAPAPADEEDVGPAGVEIAHLEILDLSDDAFAGVPPPEPSLEFTLPPGELDRIFVESRMPDLQAVPVDAPSAVAPPPEGAPPERRVHSGVSGFEVPDDVRLQVLAGIEDDAQSAKAERMVSDRAADRHPDRGSTHRPRGGRRQVRLWLSAAIVAALLLIGQLVQQNRAWFVGAGPLGSTVRAIFSSLGVAVAAPANLSAYQLRQWGVTGDPAANGVLRVRASILNVAAELQPYPLLRVTLANRFGSRIGTRDFEPSEYWASQRQGGWHQGSAPMRRWTYWIRAITQKASNWTCACGNRT